MLEFTIETDAIVEGCSEEACDACSGEDGEDENGEDEEGEETLEEGLGEGDCVVGVEL